MSSPVIVFALYPNVTQLDFSGPFEIFARLPGAKVIAASATGGAVSSDCGLVFGEVGKLEDVARCDVLCVPGGPGTAAAMLDPAFMAEVRRLGARAAYVTSVCSGSLILAAAGLITGKRAACHWGWRDLLERFGAIPDAGRVVRDGNVITGGGVTAGIDFALTLAAEIAGDEAAQTIQLMIEYAPAPPFNAGRPETAPPAIVEKLRAQFATIAPAREQAMALAFAS